MRLQVDPAILSCSPSDVGTMENVIARLQRQVQQQQQVQNKRQWQQEAEEATDSDGHSGAATEQQKALAQVSCKIEIFARGNLASYHFELQNKSTENNLAPSGALFAQIMLVVPCSFYS